MPVIHFVDVEDVKDRSSLSSLLICGDFINVFKNSLGTVLLSSMFSVAFLKSFSWDEYCIYGLFLSSYNS